MHSQSLVTTQTGRTALSVLALLVFSLNAFPALCLPPERITQALRQAETSSPSQFIGTEDPRIKILQGVRRTELLVQIFKGAKWVFYPNGKFVFVPSENANVRSDLYPIIGTYRKVSNAFEFQAERKSSTGASASVDGVIRVDKDRISLEVTQVTDAKLPSQVARIARISQTLSPASQVTAQPQTRIQEIKIPLSFKVLLQGKTEAQAFSSIPGTLKILPSTMGDSNPFFVILKTEVDNANGSLSWSSFAPVQAGRREFYSKITINGKQVRLEVNPSQEQFRSDVAWMTLVGGKIGELVRRSPIGVTVNRGTMTFSIQGNSISGKVQAEGTSEFGDSSRYEAELTGQTATEDITFRKLKQLQTKQLAKAEKHVGESITSFNGSWQVEPFGTLKLQQKGQQVRGTYIGRRGGTIEGIAQGNRLDFTWKDSTGQGWGFFRAIADGTTLTGMWGIGTDKITGQNLIATQIGQAVSPTAASSQDMRSLRDKGYNLVLQGKCQQGIAPLEAALALFKQESRNPAISDSMKVSTLIDVLDIQTHLSPCYFQSQDYKKLLINLNDVIEIRKLLNQRDYIATVNRKQANLIQGGLTGYTELWRQRLSSDVQRITALEEAQPFLQNLMRLFVESDNKQEALLVAELSKARAFADLLAARLSPSTFRVDTTPPTIQQIRQIAQTQNATLVEYTIIRDSGKDSDLFIWVVKPTGEVKFQSVSLKSLKEGSLDELIDTTRQDILDQLNDPTTDPNPKLKQLYTLLIQPVSELLPSHASNRVIFIPHKTLFLVPFPALLNANGEYLIQKHTILTVPSIQVLDSTHQLRQRNAGFAKDVLVVGNPTLAQEIQQKYGLQSLEGWEKGANEIAKLLNARAIIREQATKANILKLLPEARIIHLATHAQFEEGLKSWIALAPSGNDDGLLTSEEILDLYAPPKGKPLRAEMIVLAACKTGKGQLSADGVIGLSRSLIAAGIPTAIVSLWSVSEEETIFLMRQFYKTLSLGKAQALRQAMLATMKKYPNRPSVWAGFTLIGEAE